MRPVKLQFNGINSYRSLQLVDFEQLGAEGLFGIFGPTGSGKSSILDAITLALYGGVDRATNNTRGIIHQLEKSLEVSFEFELGGERYIAERRYERNPKDPDAAVAKQARLRKIGNGTEDVLASKPQEVTVKIEETLGISREEFSRAVVLPQGKFDQFLRMTGGDRAAMLEHLFNLEQFGEELVGKVKNEAALSVKQLERIEGEEQGLGNCSEEVVNQAGSELKIITGRYLESQKAFEKADLLHQETMKLSELFLKRKTAQEKNGELTQKQDDIKEKQTRLNTAEQAEPLRELIKRLKELTDKISAESKAYQGKFEVHADAVGRDEKAKTDLELAEKAYNEQLPQLQERKAEYQGALEKQRKLGTLQKSVKDKQSELEVLAQQTTAIEKEIVSSQSDLDNIKSVLGTLQENRSKITIDPAEKQTVDLALEVLLRLEESEKHLAEKKQTLDNRKIKTEQLWAELTEKVHEAIPEKDISSGDNIGDWTKSYLFIVEKDLNSAREAYQHALLMNSAAELVKELHKGKPCPVCGSREHPRAAPVTDESERLKEMVANAENAFKEARNWEEKALKIWNDWHYSIALLQESQVEVDQVQVELKGLLAGFEASWGSFDREGLRRRKQELAENERELHQIDSEREALLKKQDKLNTDHGKLNETLQDAKQKAAVIKADLKNIKDQMAEISDELQKITGGKDLAGLIREIAAIYQQLKDALDQAKQNEKETRGTAERLTKELSALNATLEANRKDLAVIEKRLTTGLSEAGFAAIDQAEAALLPPSERQAIRKELEEYRQAVAIVEEDLAKLDREIGERKFDEASFESMKAKRQELDEALEQLKQKLALAKNKVEELQKKQERWNELQKLRTAAEKRKNLAEELGTLLRGRKFVSFLAQEHLRDMVLEASYQLGRLTGQRYALELSKEKDCEFVIRDDYHGGNRRTINSLSGGEVFMTSLALALALSSKIQLRGQYPLGFFFLDEGFGTLDEEKLDKVMNALEKLHDRNRMVGVISHVREMKERLPRYLEVVAAGEDGGGSRIRVC